MKRCSTVTAVVVAVLSVALLALAVVRANEEDGKGQQHVAPTTPTKVFVCADSGAVSGAHELGFLHAAMEERESLQLAHCQSAYLGYLTHANGHRFRALAITTGIGFVSATVCTQSFLALQEERGLAFEAVVLMGTSGFSPFRGGWDPTNTTAARRLRQRDADPTAADTDAEEALAAAPQQVQIRKFQTRAERKRDAARDLLRAIQQGGGGGGGGGQPSGKAKDADTPRVNGIPANINWECVVSEAQVHPDGCSPMQTNPHDTSTPGLKHNQRLSIGSICVTSAAFLQETAMCTEVLSMNQCSRPHCTGFDRMMNVKNIQVAHNAGSERLVQDILEASAGKPFPPPPLPVRDGMRVFWQHNNAAVTTTAAEDLTPTFVACAESTMNAIFVGAERDYLCREHTATVLNLQHRTLHKHEGEGESGDDGEGPYTADNVVCVQAMEAFGFLESMSRYPDIPVAVVRTASNYDMYPQQKVYVPKRAVNVQPPVVEDEDTSDPILPYLWRQNPEYVSQQEYDDFVLASFHYSVQTATFVMSNYFLGGRDLSQLEAAH